MAERIIRGSDKVKTEATLSAKDCVVGRVFAAKRPRAVGSIFDPLINDRQIVWVCPLGTQVQYDSPSVDIGRRLPRVSMEKFLAWAGKDITDDMPKSGFWRSARPGRGNG